MIGCEECVSNNLLIAVSHSRAAVFYCRYFVIFTSYYQDYGFADCNRLITFSPGSKISIEY